MKDLAEKLQQQLSSEDQEKTTAAPKRRIRRTKREKVSKVPRAAKRSVKTPPAPSGKTITYNKVMSGLTGNKTRAYTVAVLRVLGVLTVKRPSVRKAALAAFFSSSSVVSHHLKKGTMEDTGDGTFRLTEEGLEFFRERSNLKDDIAAFERAIRNGEEVDPYTLIPVEIVK